MNEERLLILRMLSEGRISPEEADELLIALEAGKDKALTSQTITPATPVPPVASLSSVSPAPPAPPLPPASPLSPVPPVPPVPPVQPVQHTDAAESEEITEQPEAEEEDPGHQEKENANNGANIGPKEFENLGEKISEDIFNSLKDIKNIGADVIASIPPINLPDLKELENLGEKIGAEIKESLKGLKKLGADVRASLPPLPELKAYFAADFQGGSATFTREIELFPGDTVKLENISGDIEISAADTKALSVTADVSGIPRIPGEAAQDKCGLKAERSGNTLIISVHMPVGEGNSHRPPNVDYKLRVPKWVQIFANSVEGDISIKGMEAPVFLNTVNGDINIENCRAEIKAESVSGDINANGAKGKRIETKTVSGDVNLTYCEVEIGSKGFAKTVSGDINVNVPEGACVRYYCKTFSGDINIPKSVEYDSSDNKNVIATYNSPKSEFRLETLSGDINC